MKDWAKALEPIRAWYCGELVERDPEDMLRDVVADLQADRAQNIRMRHLLKRYHHSHQLQLMATDHLVPECPCDLCKTYRAMRDEERKGQ